MKSNHELLTQTVKCMRQAYAEISEQKAQRTYEKSAYDVVTDLDYQLEQRLMREILTLEPDAVFLSEEYNPDTEKTGRVWIIDPIDGTCNYANGIDIFGIQCALFDNGETQFAVIYLPGRDECFTAIRGHGARCNGRRIGPIVRPPEKSIISFGDFMHADPERMELEYAAMRHIAPRVERIRMIGAASVDFAYCAMGRFDGNVTFTANPWDIMPGILLCREAGLVVADVFGKPYTGANMTVAVYSSEELMQACSLNPTEGSQAAAE